MIGQCQWCSKRIPENQKFCSSRCEQKRKESTEATNAKRKAERNERRAAHGLKPYTSKRVYVHAIIIPRCPVCGEVISVWKDCRCP